MSRPASKFSGLLSAVQPAAPDVGPDEDAATAATSSSGRLSAADATGGAGASGAGVDGADAATVDDGGAVHDRTPRRPAMRARPEPSPSPAAAAPRRRGRPAGKRSDPEYDQVTAYIRRQTYRNVRIALLTQGHGQEFSELVEDLLVSWLKKGR